MHWTENLYLYRLFLIPVAFSLAAWWAWGSLLPRPRRRRDWLALIVPLFFLGLVISFGLGYFRAWNFSRARPDVINGLNPWMMVFFYGALAGVVLAGFLLKIGARSLRQHSCPVRLAILSSGVIGLVFLLAMLEVFWRAGDIARSAGAEGWPAALLRAPLRPLQDTGADYSRAYAQWVRLTLASIYGSALTLSAVLAWASAAIFRAPHAWRAMLTAVAYLAAFMAATFFWPIEFMNSCMAKTVFPYTLC